MADLTGKNISDTYTRLIQVSESKLYDGSGTSLPLQFSGDNVIVSGTLTAQTYVVSESVVNVSSGSTIFGNSSDDSHYFSGSISASIVSSSGDIKAKSLGVPTDGKVYLDVEQSSPNDYLVFQSGQIEIFKGGAQKFSIQANSIELLDDTQVTGNFTASGNISSSGNLTAANVRLPGQGIISFDNSLDGTDQFIKGADNNITIDGDDVIRLKADDHVNFADGNNNVMAAIDPNSGHVTASGNISSSGTVVASIVQSGGRLRLIPAAGHDILLDGQISIDAGVVTGATSITSTAFVGALTGNADTATTATNANNVRISYGNISDTTCYIPFVTAGTTADHALKTEAGLQYDATNNKVTATTFVGALSGNSTTATTAGILSTHWQIEGPEGPAELTAAINSEGQLVFTGADLTFTLNRDG